jgi:hypothetical protein
MASLDSIRERVEALEQQAKAMEAHTRMVERRLRWWRGIACGVVMLGLLSLALPSGKAVDAPGRGMAERMATMEKKLAAMDFDDAANEVVITGANLRIVNGLAATNTINGLGNLIVGYNELRGDGTDKPRTGSHNVVVGEGENFSSVAGLVVGLRNEISGRYASVSGGQQNIASGDSAAVSGGSGNTASGFNSSVSGGGNNTASNNAASVCGGAINIASGITASVCGGKGNIASGSDSSSVSGGEQNTASGPQSTVSGGFDNTASGLWSWVGGGGGDRNIGESGNTARGERSSVSGGQNNMASGIASSVSGGHNRTAPAQFNWAAGALFSDM